MKHSFRTPSKRKTSLIKISEGAVASVVECCLEIEGFLVLARLRLHININPCLELVRPRKTWSYLTEKWDCEGSNQARIQIRAEDRPALGPNCLQT